MSPTSPELDRPRHLVTPLDPVAAALAGALPYHDDPAELPDEQPAPSLRIRREVTAPGCRLRVEHLRGSEVLSDDPVAVDRLAFDRDQAPPRRRIHPPHPTVLRLLRDPDARRDHLEVLDDADGGQRVLLPSLGPGPHDLDRIAALAGGHRCVVVDAGLPGDPVLRAALLLRLVAGGTPCAVVPDAVRDLDLLDPELRAALQVPAADLVGDDLLLAAAAAAQKRAAWTHHDLTLAWGPSTARDGRWMAHLARPRWPGVSVVLTTRRPALLPLAAAMLAAQHPVDLEVVVALHGAGDPATARQVLAAHGLTGRVLAAPASVPFGAVIGAAVAHSSAPMVLKWDDDDLYGPHHVADLLVAFRQTGAALIGKAPEFVYLQAADTTVWRTPGRAEAASVGLAGGTFLLPRAVLDDLGGYPPVARAVDHHLKSRVVARGLRAFRTHGFGFVLRRHGDGHTWDADDARAADRAVRRMPGLPAVLDLGDAADLAAQAPGAG